MQLFPNRQTVLQIGGVHIQWYAVLIIIGACICYELCVRNFKKLNVSRSTCEDFFMESFAIGIVGARIWYVIFTYQEIYAGRPFFDMFKIWEGGLAIQGGVIAATAYGFYYFHKRGVDLWRAADCIMPNLLVAQAIGRWGNFVNQEAHGTEVTRAFLEGLHLPEFIIEGMKINGVYYHPTFLYESIGNLLVFALITLVVYRIYNRHGQLFFSYFIGYGVVRIFVEGLRTDSLMLGSLRMAQLTALAGIIIGIIGVVYLLKKGKPVTQETRLSLFPGK